MIGSVEMRKMGADFPRRSLQEESVGESGGGPDIGSASRNDANQEASITGIANRLVGHQLTNGRRLCFIALDFVHADIKAAEHRHVKLYY